MKKIIIISIALLWITSSVTAATPVSTASAVKTIPTKLSQIDDLKERLATKVAELRTSQKKAISGTVKSVTVSTVTVETKTNEVKLELTDDIKVFQIIKGKRTALTTEDLAKGDVVVVFGDFDATLDLLKAKIFFIQSALPERISGTVTGIDKTEYTVTIVDQSGKSFVVDIEKNTVVYTYSKNAGIVKGGFSKLTTGETIHALGTPNLKINNRFSGLRILDIGNMSGETPTPTSTPDVSPTASASGTPKTTAKPTAKATPKATPSPTRAP